MRATTLILVAAAAAGCARRPAPQAEVPAPVPVVDTFRIVVAATTDVHGHVRGWNYLKSAPDSDRALARAASIVDSLRAADPGHVVLVDAGDVLQGTLLTHLASRPEASGAHPVIAAMSAMRYDAVAVGNHEFDYGIPILERAIRQANFPFVSANVRRTDGSPAFPPFTMIYRGPVRIAVVGATTPGVAVWDHDRVQGKLEFRDIVPSVSAAVRAARGAGADVVIVVMHSGLDEPSSYDPRSAGLSAGNVAAMVAHHVPGIDLIVFGHTHRQLADTLIEGTRLIQPGPWAQSVGVATLDAVRDDTLWRVMSTAGRLIATENHEEDPRVVAAAARGHAAAIEYAQDSIGFTAVSWSADSARVVDTPLIDFVLEVQRKATGAQLSSTPAFSLDADLASGTITNADLVRLYPYENTLTVVRITGAQLTSYLEWSARYFGQAGSTEHPINPQVASFNYDILAGAEYTIDLSRPAGSRVTVLRVDGRDVAPTDTFTLAVSDFRQSGGGGYTMLRDAPVVLQSQLTVRQLLTAEVQRAGTLRPDVYFHPNWKLIPPPAIGSAYGAMHREWRASINSQPVQDR